MKVSVERLLELDVVLDGVRQNVCDGLDEMIGLVCGEMQFGVGFVGGPPVDLEPSFESRIRVLLL